MVTSNEPDYRGKDQEAMRKWNIYPNERDFSLHIAYSRYGLVIIFKWKQMVIIIAGPSLHTWLLLAEYLCYCLSNLFKLTGVAHSELLVTTVTDGSLLTQFCWTDACSGVQFLRREQVARRFPSQ